jgi:hypothetical protein
VHETLQLKMKLPADTVIAEEKLTRYLLVPQVRGDKSSFLERAGYRLNDFERLQNDLRVQILSLEAESLESNQFGQYFQIRGDLRGPNGVALSVRTIWMKACLES